MQIEPFATEQFFASYEFVTPHPLSVSDCETTSIAELLALAGQSLQALGRLRLGYTESQGSPLLREAIAGAYDEVNPDEVVALNAPVEGIYLTLRTLIEAEDEVVVLMPAYDALYNVAQHIGGGARRWELLPTEEGWALDFEALGALVNPKTKLLVVNFPHNPTGFLPTAAQFSRLLDFAKAHDLWLFCDEMYRGLEYGRPALPSASDAYEKCVVLGGLSKAHGLPGLRTGWLIVKDEQVRNALVNWKHYTSICPPAPSEFLALAALQVQEQLVAKSRALIEQNLALAAPFFKKWAHFFSWRPPLAGPVALVGIGVDSATAYCHELTQAAGVMLLPASFLGYDDRHVRFGFGRASFPEALAHYDAHLTRTLACA